MKKAKPSFKSLKNLSQKQVYTTPSFDISESFINRKYETVLNKQREDDKLSDIPEQRSNEADNDKLELILSESIDSKLSIEDTQEDISSDIDSKCSYKKCTKNIKLRILKTNKAKEKADKIFPFKKLSNEQLGLSKHVSVSLQYAKNVCIFFILIFGNQNMTGNLLIVSQLQMIYTLWLVFSLIRLKSSNIGFVVQEMFLNVYILGIIYFFFNSTDYREWVIIVLYFFGLLMSLFFAIFELVFIFVIRPLRKLIGKPVPE